MGDSIVIETVVVVVHCILRHLPLFTACTVVEEDLLSIGMVNIPGS